MGKKEACVMMKAYYHLCRRRRRRRAYVECVLYLTLLFVNTYLLYSYTNSWIAIVYVEVTIHPIDI